MSLHVDAVRQLTGWRPSEAAQDQLRRSFLEYLADHPDGVWRRCRPDHVTASALVLSPDRSQVLLHLHGKVGRWLQFGGHPEPGDATLLGAALREAVEEGGLSDQELREVRRLIDQVRRKKKRGTVSDGGTVPATVPAMKGAAR